MSAPADDIGAVGLPGTVTPAAGPSLTYRTDDERWPRASP